MEEKWRLKIFSVGIVEELFFKSREAAVAGILSIDNQKIPEGQPQIIKSFEDDFGNIFSFNPNKTLGFKIDFIDQKVSNSINKLRELQIEHYIEEIRELKNRNSTDKWKDGI